MEFRDWLIKNEACKPAMDWFNRQLDQSPDAIWKACPRGEWLLWWHEEAGTPQETLEPVVRRAVNRALKHSGVDFVVNSPSDYDLARMTACASRNAAWAAEVAGEACIARTIGAATWAARVAEAVENKKCADDCRELLSIPNWDKSGSDMEDSFEVDYVVFYISKDYGERVTVLRDKKTAIAYATEKKRDGRKGVKVLCRMTSVTYDKVLGCDKGEVMKKTICDSCGAEYGQRPLSFMIHELGKGFRTVELVPANLGDLDICPGCIRSALTYDDGWVTVKGE